MHFSRIATSTGARRAGSAPCWVATLVILIPLVSLILCTVPRRSALACSCAPPPGPAEALGEADAVFRGIVEGVEPAPGNLLRVSFLVTAWWKGTVEEAVEVFTADTCAACGVHFGTGEEYLVYAFGSILPEDGSLQTHLCTRSTFISLEEESANLGPPCASGDEIATRQGEECLPPPAGFRRGDSSGDGAVDLSDAILILNHLFLGGDAPGCFDAADANDSGRVDVSDGIAVINALFLGLPPAVVGEPCLEDATADDLGCLIYEACG